MRVRSTLTVAALLGAAAFFAACDDDDHGASETQEAQCESTCNAVGTCLGSNFDTSNCEDDCETAVGNGTLAQATVTDCGSCLSSAPANTCSTDCNARCQGILVPLTTDGGVRHDAGATTDSGTTTDGGGTTVDAHTGM